ncbi:unnamed protein product [Ambrosiozyma monospora]|uniref:Unnamed protein product n=1 Tax=Ambrosiozyma monospora TaxID=43982 RepID=A0ACB5TAG9_AMBMO|nr:unnamed protein product [Ambrosiozyma monospora]
MSRVLDQIILEDVAKTCPEPFLNYNKCIQSKNPNSEECIKHQFELQKCVKTQVPSFQKIQNECSRIIRNYESCLMKNQENSSSKCIDELTELRQCAGKQVGAKTE